MTQLMNMQDVQAKISEQVKVSMFNLIPDEKVQELVESEINAYFEAGTANFFVKKESGYGSNQQSIEAKVSPFRLLVWEQLNKVLSDKLQEIFKSPEFIERCIIGDGDKTAIQDAAMARQEKIALSMAAMLFQRSIEESLRNAVYDTTGQINHSVGQIMAQHGHR